LSVTNPIWSALGLNPSLRGQTSTTNCKPPKLFPFPLQAESLHQLTPSSVSANPLTYWKFVSRYTDRMFCPHRHSPHPLTSGHIPEVVEKRNSTHENILNGFLSCRPACNSADRQLIWFCSFILPHAIITRHKIQGLLWNSISGSHTKVWWQSSFPVKS